MGRDLRSPAGDMGLRCRRPLPRSWRSGKPGIAGSWNAEPQNFLYTGQSIPYLSRCLSTWMHPRMNVDGSTNHTIDIHGLNTGRSQVTGSAFDNTATETDTLPVQKLASSAALVSSQNETGRKDNHTDAGSTNTLEFFSQSGRKTTVEQSHIELDRRAVYRSSLNPDHLDVLNHVGFQKSIGQTSMVYPLSAAIPFGMEHTPCQETASHVLSSWEQHAVQPTTHLTSLSGPSHGQSSGQSMDFVNAPPLDDKEIEERGWVVILQKELRNSDVSNLGRIVLPKRDAERYLPPLFEKDGIILHVLDMSIPVAWAFKYRFWPNNKSRMYIMENTGDFVKAHGLTTGDLFIIYRDRHFGNFIARAKKAEKSPESSQASE